MELSKRLYAVASLVTEGASVADIGTDHGYIPLYLIQNHISEHVIAMDINQGPLDRAAEHIEQSQLEDKIETRLSDGMEALGIGEVDTIIAAGMGGGLIIKIMTDYPEKAVQIREFILQPQSEIGKVRRFLNESGYCIETEDMVEEDGKFYPMMRVIHGEKRPMSEEEYRYGPKLLQNKHPILYQFLQKERGIKKQLLEELSRSESRQTKKRCEELEEDLAWNQKALDVY